MLKQSRTGRWELPWSKKRYALQQSLRRAGRENGWLQAWLVRRWTVLPMIMAFLLGRATILDDLAPFGLAFFAVICFLRKELLLWSGAFLLFGSLTAGLELTFVLAAELAVFLLILKGLEKFEKADISYAPMLVLASLFIVRLFAAAVGEPLTWYALAMVAVEAALSFILTLIFFQALPVLALTRKKTPLKTEEIICLTILLASVMTGTVGWMVGPATVEHVLSRYLILLFALVGGAPLGASVGVIVGLILSLADVNAIYQMSLLAFAGMLAGLFKEGGRFGAALGMLLGTSILSVYIGDQISVLNSAWESAAAGLLFLLTPKGLLQVLAKHVPGTKENMKTHYEYAKRVRDITAGRVEQFSEVFRQLASSFMQVNEESKSAKKENEFEHFMNAVSHAVCSSCPRQKRCWGEQFYGTYQLMTEMMSAIEKGDLRKRDFPLRWKSLCIRTNRVHSVLKQQYDLHHQNMHWKRQIAESRQLVAEQLGGVSRVMLDLAKEIKREAQQLYDQEEQIRSALEDLGLSVQGIDIISLEEGNVEIEIVHRYTQGFDECRKIIAPMLSEILGETITVKREQRSEFGEDVGLVVFGSAKEFVVDTGIAGAAKGGDLLSGDSFSVMELGNGKFAVALSDGMGNGERARAESSTALTILQQFLQSGMDERLAVKSVNSVLGLRSPDEVYATVDMALIDLHNAHTTFLKIGSTPSFIKRGDEVLQITGSNLPVGILQEIDVDLLTVQLKPGDILVMMSDGVYDAPGHAVNKEQWMKRILKEIEVDDPQDFADCLLETVIRQQHGEIVDDMTVIVSRIDRFRPEWSTFRWPGITRLERPKTVS